jgi:isoamylase
MYTSGQGIRTRGPRGERITDDSFLLLLHRGDEDQKFTLPGQPWASGYLLELDTAQPELPPGGHIDASAKIPLTARSVVLLRAQP